MLTILYYCEMNRRVPSSLLPPSFILARCLFLFPLWGEISCQYHIYIHVNSTDLPPGGLQSVSNLLIIL